MEHLKEQLEIKLAEAEDILEQTDVHDDLEYGKAQGVVEALRMALNLVVARRVENLEQEVEYMQQKRKEYTGPAYDSFGKQVAKVRKELAVMQSTKY